MKKIFPAIILAAVALTSAFKLSPKSLAGNPIIPGIAKAYEAATKFDDRMKLNALRVEVTKYVQATAVDHDKLVAKIRAAIGDSAKFAKVDKEAEAWSKDSITIRTPVPILVTVREADMMVFTSDELFSITGLVDFNVIEKREYLDSLKSCRTKLQGAVEKLK